MTLLDLDPQTSPRVRPLTYPGAWPEWSALFSSHGLWRLTDREDSPMQGGGGPYRLGHARVRVPAERRESLRLGGAVSPMLVDVLERLNVVGMDARVPVISVGSNASPAQMGHKFLEHDVTSVIPMVVATVTGGTVGFAPAVAPAGYVPGTVVPAPGTATRLFVQFLDPAQLALLDRTETGYKRVRSADAGLRVELDTGEMLGNAYAYVFDSGWLADDHGPLRMRNQLDPDPDASAVADQSALLERLTALPAVREIHPDPATWMAEQSPQSRRALAVAFRESGMVAGDEFARDLPDATGEPPERYLAGSLAPSPGAFIVRASGDDIHREGESVVRLARRDWLAAGSPRHVEVTSDYVVATRGELAPTALAAVVVSDAATPGEAEVDHVLRMAVGLEIGERVRVRPVELRRTPVPNLVFGVPNSVTMRVTLADPSTAERRVALVSELSLALLGVESGDKVLVEGTAGDDGVVPVEVLTAFAIPESLAQERAESTSGSWGTRFPSARDVFGVNPDLPAIFLDGATRTSLGLQGQQLASVRLRPARGHQFVREVREIALVLAVALLGVVGLVDEPALVWGLVGVLVVASVGLVVGRMRGRLSHSTRPGRRR